MAEDQPAKWGIFCVVIDENSPFSVKIQPDATVDELKKAIKLKKQPDFDGFPADSLTLFKVEVLALDLSKALKQIEALDLSSSPEMKMNPLFELKDYYSDAPPKKTIHILVQTPSIGK